MRFVDTNILLYAISSRPGEAEKARRAVALLNEPDLAELPEELRKDMRFVPVESLEQVLNVAMTNGQA